MLIEGSLEVKLPTSSDNMDRWKAELGRVREMRRVEKRRVEERRAEERRSEKRKSQKKEDEGAQKGRKVAKSMLAKAAGAEPSGQMSDKKLHAVVAWSTFRSQNVQSTWWPEHFCKLRCRKSARRCGAKHISKSKCTKHTRFGALLHVEMSKKCTPLWREAHFEVKMLKTQGVRTTFGRWDVVSRGRRKGLCTLSKVSKPWGFCGISKNDGRRGTFEEDLQRCIFRGRRSTRDMFIRAVRRSWEGLNLEHQIFRFAEVILRDRCSTSYDLASLFCGLCFLVLQNERIVCFAVGCLRSPFAVAMHFLTGNGIGVILVVAAPPSLTGWLSKEVPFLNHFSILRSAGWLNNWSLQGWLHW